ncbi:hypothetical protein GCM10010435_92840 [Winogradskya consettensis]|uniref:Phosphoribosylanthranilate isomerase n=1 Tax=Winogradskya consettensis TaxID=113560 RepID=A0A919VPD8_9ACTN|nr:hypothetical protein [Actinoplanes consettensis]GIM71231.1 hypothetical protein Aco04nite_24270 [Actinoplanes consettensis]
MTNDLIKVDRVRSAQEASVVEGLGARLVTVSLSPDPRFDDDRTVTVEQAAEIGRALRRARLVVAMDLRDDPGRIRRVVAGAGASMVQPITVVMPPVEVRVALRDAGIGVVYGGIEIAHDDDPGWVFDGYDSVAELDAALFHADVLPEYENSWAFLRDESPEFEEEFQIADLNELARTHPMVVGLDFTPGNVKEILAALPEVRGIALTLADKARRDGARWHRYGDVVRVLQAL